MEGGTKSDCSFCRRPFRVKSERKEDLKEDFVEEVEISGSFSKFAPVWTLLGTEVVEEGSSIVPRICGPCYEIVEEVESIHEELEVLKGMLEVAVGRLRRIVKDSAPTITRAEESITLKEEEEQTEAEVELDVVVEPKQEVEVNENEGGVSDGDNDGHLSNSASSDGDDNDDLSNSDVSSSEEEEVTMKRKRRKLSTPGDPLANESSAVGQKKRQTKMTVSDIPKIPNLQTCEFCLKKIKLSDLVQHLSSHVNGNEDYVLRCLNPNCKTAFLSSVRLAKHLENSPICRLTSESLGSPLQTSPLFTCEVCGFTPPKPRGMPVAIRSHLKTHEVELPKKFSCPVDGCRETFALKQSVRHHLTSHQGGRTVVKCDVCKKSLANFEACVKHHKKAHPETPVIQCGVCGLVFLDRQKWLGHHTKKHRWDKITCDLCQISVSSDVKIHEHYFEKHGIGTQFRCERCSAVFYSNRWLQAHMRAAHAMRKRPKFQCDRCDAAFPLKMSLTSHQMEEHGDKGFQCSECGRLMSSAAFLELHMREVHGGDRRGKEVRVKKHICDECGRGFSNNQALRSHVAREHAENPEVRPFACEVERCGKAFYDQNSFNVHKNKVHPEVRPVCEVCGKSFGTAVALRIHSAIHTEECRYVCNVCDQRFRLCAGLMAHLKSHEKKGEKAGGMMMERKTKVEGDKEGGKLL